MIRLSDAQRLAEARLHASPAHTLGSALTQVFVVRHPRRLELLGAYWSSCERSLWQLAFVLRSLRAPAAGAMNEAERAYLYSLPDLVAVWRGCYRAGRAGFSWSTKREIAERFPNVYLEHGYGLTGDPLLLSGTIRKTDVLFVKLDRGEFEVVGMPEVLFDVREYPNRCAERLLRRASDVVQGQQLRLLDRLCGA